MRWVLVALVLLAGCGSSQPKGPAWPAPSTTAEDGGESIEPRPSATYAAAVEKSAEPEPDQPASEDAAAPEASAWTTEAPEATPAAQPSIDDVIMSEEIIIEIEDE